KTAAVPPAVSGLARSPADGAGKGLHSSGDGAALRLNKADDVINAIIRELEQCRALLQGAVAAGQPAEVKRARAGGRT
ncbi:MAG: hypothetical protein ABL907_12360, partial [Hyphomicrobium sp.]